MTEPPRTYTERRDLIAKKLEPYFQVSAMVATNTRPTCEPVEELRDNSLWCTWADRETGWDTLAVLICHVVDGQRRAEETRELMTFECSPGLDLRVPNREAYEIVDQRAGEFVFVLNYVGGLRAITGNCFVEVMPPPGSGVELAELADVALDIGRSVGCSAYENDFTLPDIPE